METLEHKNTDSNYINKNIENIIFDYAESYIVGITALTVANIEFMGSVKEKEIEITEYYIMTYRKYHVLESFISGELDEVFDITVDDVFIVKIVASNRNPDFDKILNETDFSISTNLLSFIEDALIRTIFIAVLN